MVRRKDILLAGVLAGISLLLAGCGDDLEAVVPLIGSVAVEGEGPEVPGLQSTEENDGDARKESIEETEEHTGEDRKDDTEENVGDARKEGVEKAEQVSITISAAGDCSLGNYYQQEYYASFDQTYEKNGDMGYFFQNVRDIFEADDMTIVNLEGVLTTSEEPEEGRTFNIKGDPSYVGILTAGNVEAVSMANNHRLDYGEAGTEDTVKVLEEAGIVYAYDKIVGMYEVKGINIGIVSVNEVAWGDKCGALIESGIGLLKEQEADLIIACCHWGVEKEHYTEEYQNELGRICIDAGADLVLGHHPHVLQGIEEYQGKYIVYSLANFCFGANRNPSDKDTMIFQQTFTFADGVLQEGRQARVIPCSVSSVKERNNYQPTPLTDKDAERVISRINTYSEVYGVVLGSDGNVDLGR